MIHGTEEETLASYTSEKIPVGSKMVIEDGRTFRFCENGADALVAGNLQQALVPSTNRSDEIKGNSLAIAAGVTVLTGVGATGADTAVDLLKYGYCYSDSATAANFMPVHRVKSNTLLDAGAVTGTITLFTPLKLPLAAAQTISYFPNPWRDVIITAAPATGLAVGVAPIALAANAFGWLQTGGPCAVAYDASTTTIAAIGDPVAVTVTTAGAVQGVTAAGAEVVPVIGWALDIVQADTEMTVIWLQLE